MKTETLTIRLTPEDKQLVSDLAWKRRQSMAEMIVTLTHDAAEHQNPDPAPDIIPTAEIQTVVAWMRAQMYGDTPTTWSYGNEYDAMFAATNFLTCLIPDDLDQDEEE